MQIQFDDWVFKNRENHDHPRKYFSAKERKLGKKLNSGIALHYNFMPILVCISEMGITAGFCTLKAQFIPPDFPFESASFDSVQIR